jgi:nucleotidyltransferase substrate binding protein (TIGR01987 family)
MTHDIRWKQRFFNYERCFKLLERTLLIANPSEAERGGLIQFYEMAFELAWKTLKDYLTEQGFDVTTPREAIKQGFQAEIIEDGHLWLQALTDRNLTVHTYDENKAKEVENSIREHYNGLLKQLYDRLKTEY